MNFILLILTFVITAPNVLVGEENDPRRDPAVIAVEKVIPSVVNIATETIVYTRHPLEDLIREFYDPFYRKRTTNTLYSLGSGVIIDEDGYIVTNEHVVRSASRISVKLHDGREYECDRIVGSSKSDIALLKIRSNPGEKFPAAKFAKDGDLLLGETVLALGNPFGLGGSVTRGILSSKNRRPPRENEPLDVADWLQTDAAINPGNSGGPLINLKGEVIGINVAVYREGQGIGFAIPVKLVSEAISEIFIPENLKSLWFGAKIKNGAGPLTVQSVEPLSPADKAGIKVGDVILGINGKFGVSYIALINELTEKGEKTPCELIIKRDDSKKTIKIQLTPEKSFFNEELIRKRLGILVEEINEETAINLGMPILNGLLIKSVDENSPADKAGLVKGLIINELDGLPADSILRTARLIHTKKIGEPIKMKVIAQRRRGYLMEVRTFEVELKIN